MIGRKPKLKEKLIEKNSNEADEQFIFFDFQKEKKFQQQIEIQAILNSNNSYKVMVIVDGKSTLDYLCMKIAEQMEKFHEYTNLEGLKAINLTKKAEKGVIKIPSSGELKDYLTGGDIIYCDLTTQEYWVKTNIKIFSSYSKMIINLDLKFRLETIFKKLKFLLIKLGTNFWIDYTKGKKDSFHYTFVNAKFKTMKSKNNFELNINDINKSIQIESSKYKRFDY
jgi:hypothetical protein